MITKYRNKALQHLGISFVLFILIPVFIVLRSEGLPKIIFAVAVAVLVPFMLIFYVQGNIALAKAKGYDSSVVAAVIIVAAFCCGYLFIGMPLIILFALKDKTYTRKRSDSEEKGPARMNPIAELPPRRDQDEGKS
jgi:hypothetical protein